MEVDINAVLTIVSATLTIVAAFAGAKWQKAKAKAEQFSDFVKTLTDAAQDDKVTEEEFQAIVAKVKALMNNG